MKIRQRPVGPGTRTYPVFDGTCSVVSVITEDNGMANDAGIILVASGTDPKGEERTYRIELSKVESARIHKQIATALSKAGPNFVKESVDVG